MTSEWWMLGAAGGASAAGGAAAGTAAGTAAGASGLGATAAGGLGAGALGGATMATAPATLAGAGAAPAASLAPAAAASMAPALGGATSALGPATLNTALPAVGGGSAPALGASGPGLGTSIMNGIADASDWVYNPVGKLKEATGLAGKGTNQGPPQSPGERILGNVMSQVSLSPPPYQRGAPSLPSRQSNLTGMNPQVPTATGQFQMGPNGFLRYVGPGAT